MNEYTLTITESTTSYEVVTFFNKFRAGFDQWHSDWTAECVEHEKGNPSVWAYCSTLECWATVYPWTDKDVHEIIGLAKAYQLIGPGKGGSYRDYLFHRTWEIISRVTGTNKFGHPRIYFN